MTLERPQVVRCAVFLTFWLRQELSATAACTFQQIDFQKCSGPEVLLAFWLPHVLGAAATFWTLILPDGSAPAPLASLITFRLSGDATLSEKHRVFRGFLLFCWLSLLWLCPEAGSLTSKLLSTHAKYQCNEYIGIIACEFLRASDLFRSWNEFPKWQSELCPGVKSGFLACGARLWNLH
jgi:hypothetical protein